MPSRAAKYAASLGKKNGVACSDYAQTTKIKFGTGADAVQFAQALERKFGRAIDAQAANGVVTVHYTVDELSKKDLLKMAAYFGPGDRSGREVKASVSAASQDQEQPEPSPARKIAVTKPMLRVLADKKRYVWVKWPGGAETMRLVQVSTDGEKYKFRDEWKKRDVIIPFGDIRELRAPEVQASQAVSASDRDLVDRSIGYLRSGPRKLSDLAEVMNVDQHSLLKALTATGVKSSRGVSKNSFSDKKNPVFMYKPVKGAQASIRASGVNAATLPGAASRGDTVYIDWGNDDGWGVIEDIDMSGKYITFKPQGRPEVEIAVNKIHEFTNRAGKSLMASSVSASSGANDAGKKYDDQAAAFLDAAAKAMRRGDHAAATANMEAATQSKVTAEMARKQAKKASSVSAAANDTASARYSFPDAKSAASFVQRVTSMGLKAGASGLVAAVVKPGMKAAAVSDAARSLGGKPTVAQDVSASNDPAVDAKISARLKELSSKQTADLKDIYSRYHRVSDIRGVPKRDLVSDILAAEFGRKKISAFFDAKKASVSAAAPASGSPSGNVGYEFQSEQLASKFIDAIFRLGMKGVYSGKITVVKNPGPRAADVSDLARKFGGKPRLPRTPVAAATSRTGLSTQLASVLSRFVSNGELTALVDDVKSGDQRPLAGAQSLLRGTGGDQFVDKLARELDAIKRSASMSVAAASGSDRGYYVTIRPRPTDSLQSFGEDQKWTKAKAYEEAKRQSTKYHYARVIAPNHTIESEWSDGVNKG